MEGRVTEKICGKCSGTKQITDFYKDKGKKDGHRSECKECTRRKNRQYYEENGNAVRENVRLYRLNNLECVQGRKREYNQRYREENRELIRQRGREYRLANLDSIRKRIREYGKSNPERNRAKKSRRRQRLTVHMDETDRLLSVEWRKAIANDPCAYCNQHSTEMHDDHVVPLARGGTDHWWNLVRACAPCNWAKADKTTEDFLEYLRR